MRKKLLLSSVAAATVAVFAAGPTGAQVIPGVGVIHKKNLEYVFNVPAAVGGDIEFYEALQADGSVKRYAVYTSMGNGFNIVDITDPELPVPTGAFVDPGVNWQGDVQINPRRKIAVLATQGSIGVTVGHGASDGLAFVDISNPASPTLLGVVNGLEGAAHNSTIINDQYVYTTGGSNGNHVVDYSNPSAPVDRGRIPNGVCPGHDITVDPNRPTITYHACGSGNTSQIYDVTDPLNPQRLAQINTPGMSVAHQADPNVDSTLLFITDEQGGGLTNPFAPGGGLHAYDISGKYVEGASITSPVKVGFWVPPFEGVKEFVSAAPDAWGNVTAHNITFQAERHLLSVGWYTMGSWVTDLQYPTNNTGPYEEYQGTRFGGPTTWGNTQAGIILEGAETWSSKWTRFDDPLYDRYLFTNDITRGMDVLRYTGALPQKVARLSVDAEATGGAVTGVLDRYAVWTHQGYVNKPLMGKVVKVKVDGGASVSVVTDADGAFSADLGLAPGSYEVTVTWTDASGVYQTASQTLTVTA